MNGHRQVRQRVKRGAIVDVWYVRYAGEARNRKETLVCVDRELSPGTERRPVEEWGVLRCEEHVLGIGEKSGGINEFVV